MKPDLQILRGLLLPPDLGQLTLLGPLILFLEYVLWAFLGVVLVSTLLATALRRSQPALAADLAHVVPGRVGPWIALGALPLAALVFLFGQLVYGGQFDLADALLLAAPPALVGLAAGLVYRRWPGSDRGWAHAVLGGITVLALLAFLAPFQQWMAQLVWPELWPLVNPLLPELYNVQGLVRLLIFLVTALFVTGAVLLFVYFLWPERRLPPESPHGPRLARLALVLVLVGCLGLPALVVWDSAILPTGARAAAGLHLAGGVVAAAWLTALLALGRLLRGQPGRVLGLCLLAAVALGLELGRQHSICTTALADQLAAQRLTATAKFAVLQEKQEARYPSRQPLGVEVGAALYQERCTACHQWDARVVGPPHREVLPKYQGDVAKLAEFIRNPVKVDLAYPPMPKPGLSRREAGAIAEYLLQELKAKSP
ncbi:cytochrome c [bacterium]|nr:cytochrome c [bacterium]